MRLLVDAAIVHFLPCALNVWSARYTGHAERGNTNLRRRRQPFQAWQGMLFNNLDGTDGTLSHWKYLVVIISVGRGKPE